MAHPQYLKSAHNQNYGFRKNACFAVIYFLPAFFLNYNVPHLPDKAGFTLLAMYAVTELNLYLSKYQKTFIRQTMKTNTNLKLVLTTLSSRA